jgi:hypothetical protein
MLINNQIKHYAEGHYLSNNSPFWFIKDGEKLILCKKEAFDKAITEGKSVKYRGYANKRCERIADQLEESRMAFLADPNLPPKFRAAITNPRNVCEVQVVLVDDPQFWLKESKRPKYQK